LAAVLVKEMAKGRATVKVEVEMKAFRFARKLGAVARA